LPPPLVNTWSNTLQLCIGQYKTARKANEITAIDALLDMLPLNKFIPTISIVVDNASDYLLAVKGNQATFYKSILQSIFSSTLTYEQETTLKNTSHNRLEERRRCTLKASLLPDEIEQSWSAIATLVQVTSKRQCLSAGKISKAKRYYISILSANKLNFNELYRGHWSIVNRLHWSLDIQLNEDASTKRRDNLPQNYGLILKVTLNLLKQMNDKLSIKRRRF